MRFLTNLAWMTLVLVAVICVPFGVVLGPKFFAEWMGFSYEIQCAFAGVGSLLAIAVGWAALEELES